jgi:hypothetical protein
MSESGTATPAVDNLRRLSPWRFAIASIVLAGVTLYLSFLYGIAHWDVGAQSASLRCLSQRLGPLAEKYIPVGTDAQREWELWTESVGKSTNRLSRAANSLMAWTEVYT